MVDEGCFAEAFADIAKASIEPEHWGSALASLAEAAGAEASLLLPANPRVQPLWSVSGQGLMDEYVREGWGHRNLRIERALRTPVLRAMQTTLQAPHVPFASSFVGEADLFPDGDFVGSIYYEEFMARHGLRWCCGAPLLTVTNDVVFLTFERRPNQGPFQRNELQKLKHMLPVLQTAISLTSVAAKAQGRGMLAAFDSLDHAAFLVDAAGRVCGKNACAERLAREQPLLQGGRFAVPHAADQRNLDRLIGAALSASNWSGRPAIPAAIRRPDGSPLIVHALPAPAAAWEPFYGARLILVVVDPDKRRLPEDAALSASFGLTPAEARVARAIADGQTVDVIAFRLGVSPLTVRSQLKSALAKCGLKRQTELGLLIAGMVTPRPPR